MISGKEVYEREISSEYLEDGIEANIINIMATSKEVYRYNSLNQYKFELNMRKNIIDSSRELNDSRVKFKTFKESFCNKDFWQRTDEGGFKLKDGMKPSEAINDIFKNSSKYGTECSTAIIILYYKSILNIYSEELFNKTFPNIVLLNWHNFGDNLSVYSYETEDAYLPADCLYFENPDYDPAKSEWRGENAIDLGNKKYYGHGIGIADEKHIIKSLNKYRKSNAKREAYLTQNIARPNFRHLADIYLGSLERMRYELFRYSSFYR